jgi:hypothetical protein
MVLSQRHLLKRPPRPGRLCLVDSDRSDRACILARQEYQVRVAVMQAPKHQVHSKADPNHHIVPVRLSHRGIARGELLPSQAEIHRRTRLVQKKQPKID